MKLSLDALLVLESIKRNGSFALAAQELHKVPSALTYTINKLEEQLDIAIFDRNGHRAVLTPIGEYLLNESYPLLQAAEEIERNISIQKTGWEQSITIAYDQLIPFENLLPIIDNFDRKCPNVELNFRSEVLSGSWDALINKRADLTIGVTGDPPIKEGLNIQPLGQIDFVFVTSPTHELVTHSKEGITKSVRNFRIVTVADTGISENKRTTGVLPGQRILSVSSFNEKIAAIQAGLGVGYLPRLMAQKYLDSGDLVEHKINKIKSSGTIAYAWFDNNLGNAKKWFIETLSRDEIKQQILNANYKSND